MSKTEQTKNKNCTEEKTEKMKHTQNAKAESVKKNKCTECGTHPKMQNLMKFSNINIYNSIF